MPKQRAINNPTDQKIIAEICSGKVVFQYPHYLSGRWGIAVDHAKRLIKRVTSGAY